MTLRDKIAQEIRERGPIAFSRYMELCLYDDEFGYYSRNAEQFGFDVLHPLRGGRLQERRPQFDEVTEAVTVPAGRSLVAGKEVPLCVPVES